jgi:hypothetical protein
MELVPLPLPVPLPVPLPLPSVGGEASLPSWREALASGDDD